MAHGRLRTAADVKRVLDSTVAGAEAEAVGVLQQVCSKGGRPSAQIFWRALTQKDDSMGRSPLILAVDYRLPACAKTMLEALGCCGADGLAALTVVDSCGRSVVPTIVHYVVAVHLGSILEHSREWENVLDVALQLAATVVAQSPERASEIFGDATSSALQAQNEGLHLVRRMLGAGAPTPPTSAALAWSDTQTQSEWVLQLQKSLDILRLIYTGHESGAAQHRDVHGRTPFACAVHNLCSIEIDSARTHVSQMTEEEQLQHAVAASLETSTTANSSISELGEPREAKLVQEILGLLARHEPSTASCSTTSEELDLLDNLGTSPLHSAAAAGRHQLVALLLDLGCSTHTIDCFGSTPLHAAVAATKGGRLDHVEHIEQLQGRMEEKLSTGMLDDTRHSRDAAKIQAEITSMQADIDTTMLNAVDTYLNVNADIGARPVLAVDHLQTVHLLLKAGASPMQTNEIDNTPLHLVRNTAVLRLLLDAVGQSTTDVHQAMRQRNANGSRLLDFVALPPRILGPGMANGTYVGGQPDYCHIGVVQPDARDELRSDAVAAALHEEPTAGWMHTAHKNQTRFEARLRPVCWRDRAPERSADVSSLSTTALLRQVCEACSTETVQDGGAELIRRVVYASGGDSGVVREKFRARVEWWAAQDPRINDVRERPRLGLPFNYQDSEWRKALFDEWWVQPWPDSVLHTRLSILVAAMVPASATPSKSRLETVSQQEVHEPQLPTPLLPPARVLMCAAASVAVPKRVRLVASIYRIDQPDADDINQLDTHDDELGRTVYEGAVHVATRATLVKHQSLWDDARQGVHDWRDGVRDMRTTSSDIQDCVLELADVLAFGCDPNLRAGDTGHTPLHTAVLSVYRELVNPCHWSRDYSVDHYDTEHFTEHFISGKVKAQQVATGQMLQRCMDALKAVVATLLANGADPNFVASFPHANIFELLGITEWTQNTADNSAHTRAIGFSSCQRLSPLRLLVLASQAASDHIRRHQVGGVLGAGFLESRTMILNENDLAQMFLAAGSFIGGDWLLPSEVSRRLPFVEKAIVLQGLRSVPSAQWFAFSLSAHNRLGAESHMGSDMEMDIYVTIHDMLASAGMDHQMSALCKHSDQRAGEIDVVFHERGSIGILFEAESEYGLITISQVKKASQASERSELERGLALLKVQGKPTEGLTFEQALQLISEQRPLRLTFSSPSPLAPTSFLMSSYKPGDSSRAGIALIERDLQEFGLDWWGDGAATARLRPGFGPRLILQCNVAKDLAQARGFSDEGDIWRAILQKIETQHVHSVKLTSTYVGGVVTAMGSEGQRSITGSDGRVHILGPGAMEGFGSGGSHCVLS